MKIIPLLPLVACMLAPLASADDCAAATTQTQINQCAAQQSQAVDKQLNTVYQQISQRLKGHPETQKRLLTTQRSWLIFRDAECRFASSTVSGGSAYAGVYAGCLTAQNQQRAQALKIYLTCAEGDLSCPVPAQ